MKLQAFFRTLVGITGFIGLLCGSTNAQVPTGTPLPDVTVYDASGQPFVLSALQGSYSVLVFGCLT